MLSGETQEGAMKVFLLGAVAACAIIATPATAQQIGDITSQSGSNSTANSGSVSGAQSNNQANNANQANNNIGTSESTSNSNAGAVSGSDSTSTSNGNQQGQQQGQAQDAHNTQGQMQGQTASNQNGQAVNLTFNSHSPDHLQVKTNTPVGLTASSSFSSDYCGATQSAGASAAPLGISIGASGPRYDKSCQALRRAEKFGMAAANAQNMGQPELAQRLMSMMIWSICTADTAGPNMQEPTAMACSAVGLMGTPMGPGAHAAANPPDPQPVGGQKTKVAQNGMQVQQVAAAVASDMKAVTPH
jgi:hypothetical protein